MQFNVLKIKFQNSLICKIKVVILNIYKNVEIYIFKSCSALPWFEGFRFESCPNLLVGKIYFCCSCDFTKTQNTP
jgi:hypothetical protein